MSKETEGIVNNIYEASLENGYRAHSKKIRFNEPSEEVIKEKSNEELPFKLLRGKTVCPISSKEFQDLILNNREVLANSIIYDYKRRAKIIFDSDGAILDNQDISKFDYDRIKYTTRISPVGSIYDVSNSSEKPKVDKTDITLLDALEFIKNPVSHNFKIDLPKSNINSLIACIFTQKDQFDELFTVETCKPESPLMRKYLTELARLVNIKLKESDEIDNIEELEKLAYEKAEYKGKSIETVLNESKDYHDYYRFLLMKGERIVITENEKEYVDTLYRVVSESKNIFRKDKKSKIDFELRADINSISSRFTFSEKVDLINFGDSIYFTLFFYIPEHMSKVEEYIEKEEYIKLKAAHVTQILEASYRNSSNNGDLKCSLFICDKNYNYSTFTVSSTTMNKWKKELNKMLMCLDVELEKGFEVRMLGLNNLGI